MIPDFPDLMIVEVLEERKNVLKRNDLKDMKTTRS